MEEAVFIYSDDCIDNLFIHCNACNMGLNGLTHWEDHKMGKKHRGILKPKRKRKVIVPTGTVIIIKQRFTMMQFNSIH